MSTQNAMGLSCFMMEQLLSFTAEAAYNAYAIVLRRLENPYRATQKIFNLMPKSTHYSVLFKDERLLMEFFYIFFLFFLSLFITSSSSPFLTFLCLFVRFSPFTFLLCFSQFLFLFIFVIFLLPLLLTLFLPSQSFPFSLFIYYSFCPVSLSFLLLLSLNFCLSASAIRVEPAISLSHTLLVVKLHCFVLGQCSRWANDRPLPAGARVTATGTVELFWPKNICLQDRIYETSAM